METGALRGRLRSTDEIEKQQAEQAAKAYYDGPNECVRPMSDAEMIAKLFTYHPPTPVTTPKFEAINLAAKHFAEVVAANCPPGPDRSDVIRKIREARMTANAAIALNGFSFY